MELIPRAGTSPVQIHSLPQPCECTLAGAFKALAFAHDLFKTRSKQGADGSVFLRGEYAGFAQQIRIEFQGHIALHA